MNKITKRLLIILGIISVITSLGGIAFNVNSLYASFSGRFQNIVSESNLIYFYEVFYTMSFICLICYFVLLFCGINFLKMKIRFVWLFVSVLIVEIVYLVFVVGYLHIFEIGALRESAAAAMGVANGSLMIQFTILFPLWGIALAIWAKRKSQIII